jgi:hypothetical protein
VTFENDEIVVGLRATIIEWDRILRCDVGIPATITEVRAGPYSGQPIGLLVRNEANGEILSFARRPQGAMQLIDDSYVWGCLSHVARLRVGMWPDEVQAAATTGAR